MVVVEGHFWRVPRSGEFRETADSDLAAFAVVTSFRPERSLRQLDRLRTMHVAEAPIDADREKALDKAERAQGR
jgi:hypothetical protein